MARHRRVDLLLRAPFGVRMLAANDLCAAAGAGRVKTSKVTLFGVQHIVVYACAMNVYRRKNDGDYQRISPRVCYKAHT